MHLGRVVFYLFFTSAAISQINQFPYLQNFDSITPPALPAGWLTTTNRAAIGDFITTRSLPLSDSNTVISTNATIEQILMSPVLDFRGKEADSLKFYERRSGSHDAGLLIEASADGGETFPILMGDTLKNTGKNAYVTRNIKLGEVLSNQPAVVIRWNIMGNGTGSSGTIRFDNIEISAKNNIDLTVSKINFAPQFPSAGDSVAISATIKNIGLLTVQYYSVRYYRDQNANSVPEPEELIAELFSVSAIAPGDSAIFTTSVNQYQEADYSIIVLVTAEGDQNQSNNLKISLLKIGVRYNSIIINEIMYAPRSPEPEWVELLNISNDSVDIKDWKISNRNSSSRYTLANSPTILSPGNYCIITKDLAQFTAIHPDIIGAIIQPAHLPTYLFNNEGDAVVIFDQRGAIVDSVRYNRSWGGQNGESLERIEGKVNSNDSTNWSECRDTLGSTPGCRNYSTPLEYDLRIRRIVIDRPSKAALSVRASVCNAGYNAVKRFSASFFYDLNHDSIPEPEELIQSVNVEQRLEYRDSVLVEFQWEDPPPGSRAFIVAVVYSEDQRPSDNIYRGIINNSYDHNILVINEIMYEPLSGDAEYVELLYRGDDPIDISEWKISDSKDSTLPDKYILSPEPYYLVPGDLLTVGFDSSIYSRFHYLADQNSRTIIKENLLNLNNEGDEVVLTDLTGKTIDSLYYLPSWHNPDLDDSRGRSLERINPDITSTDKRNWSTSAGYLGGSPGRQNSIYASFKPTDNSLSFLPNPFSPDGDGFEDNTIMNYRLSSFTALIRVRIFDSKGRLVRVLADCEPSGSNGSLIWDGYSDENQRAKIGIYIVLFEALDGTGSGLQIIKGTVVVAAKL